MSTYITGNDGDGIVASVNYSQWVNMAGTYVVSQATAFNFAASSGNRLGVHGVVSSGGESAVTAGIGSFNLAVEVGTGGFVSGFFDGIALKDTSHEVVNHGVVEGLSGAGINLGGEGDVNGGSVTNFGHVYGRDEGVTAWGSSVAGVNAGKIVGGDVGVQLLDAHQSFLGNGGSIDGYVGVQLSGHDSDSVNRFSNTGTVTGENLSVMGSGGTEIVNNAGTISGDIYLLNGNDMVRNGGAIDGVVDLGEGADVYRARGDGSAVAVNGYTGDDVLAGGSAADLLSGGEGHDTVLGGDGTDTVSGDLGNDVVSGGAGNDELDGSYGADTLRGGEGQDTLAAGRQNDLLFGGSDADVFVFAANTDVDVVRDFQNDVDVLDLTGLGFADLAAALATASTTSGDTVFDLAGNDRITLHGITVNQLADDILI